MCGSHGTPFRDSRKAALALLDLDAVPMSRAGVTAVGSPGPERNGRLRYGEDRRDRVTLR